MTRTILGGASVLLVIGYVALTEYRMREAASARELQERAWRDEVRQIVRSQSELRGAVALTSSELRRDQLTRSVEGKLGQFGTEGPAENDAESEVPKSDEELEEEARDQDRQEQDLVTEAHKMANNVIANERPDKTWSNTIQNTVQAFAGRLGEAVDDFKCGGPYCSFTIPTSKRTAYGPLVSDLAGNVEYIGFQPADEQTFTVLLARQAEDFGALKQTLR
jgi:hypothetical protein